MMDANTTNAPTYTEAPASFTVKYYTKDGFDAMLTLRGSSGADLLPRAEAALSWLIEHGCRPTHGWAAPAPGTEGPPAVVERHTPPPAGFDGAWCGEHAAPMEERRGKDGATWYSHRLPDGSWCRGSVAP